MRASKKAAILAAVAVAVSILVLAVGPPSLSAAGTSGEIKAGKGRFIEKSNDAWKDKGRIVGKAEGGKTFSAEVSDSEGKVVKTHSGATKAYELEWLEPGTYSLRISATGYKPLVIKDLKVRAKADLRIDIEFTSD